MYRTVLGEVLRSIEGDIEHKVNTLMTHFTNGCEIKDYNTGKVYCQIPPANPPLPHYFTVKKYIAEYQTAAESNLYHFQDSLWALQLLIITNPWITLSTLKNIDPDRQEALDILLEYSYAFYQFSAYIMDIGGVIVEALESEEGTDQILALSTKIRGELALCLKDVGIFSETQIKIVDNFNNDGTLTAEAMARVNRVGRSDYVTVDEGVVTIDFAGAARALELTGEVEGGAIGEV